MLQWYDWHTVSERLQGRLYALTRGKPYKLRLDPQFPTGYCDLDHKVVGINPVAFNDTFAAEGLESTELDEANFLMSRALTGHEALHTEYTDAAALREAHRNTAVKNLWNILEDARVEGIGADKSHVSKLLFRLIKKSLNAKMPDFQDPDCTDPASWFYLLMRWRCGLRIPEITDDAKKLWRRVRNIAEESLYAHDSWSVLEAAREIGKITGVGKRRPKSDTQKKMNQVMDKMSSSMDGSSKPKPNPRKRPEQKSEPNEDSGSQGQSDTNQSSDAGDTGDQQQTPGAGDGGAGDASSSNSNGDDQDTSSGSDSDDGPGEQSPGGNDDDDSGSEDFDADPDVGNSDQDAPDPEMSDASSNVPGDGSDSDDDSADDDADGASGATGEQDEEDSGVDGSDDMEGLKDLLKSVARQVRDKLSDVVPQGNPRELLVAGARGGRLKSIEACPYMHLLDQAVPIAQALERELKGEDPKAVQGPSRTAGRFKARYYVRDSDRPFAQTKFHGMKTPQMALSLILDRSISMQPNIDDLRVMSMAIYLVCEKLRIPLAIWVLEGQVHLKRFDEWGPQVLAKIAGIHANTYTNMMPTITDACQELSGRPEALKQVVLIHDGCPGDPIEVTKWSEAICDFGLFCMYIMPEEDYDETYRVDRRPFDETMTGIFGSRRFAVAKVKDMSKNWCSYMRTKRKAYSVPV